MIQSKEKQIFTYILSTGVTFLITFISQPYLARSLNYIDFGSYSQVLLIGSYASIILGLSIYQIINVLYPEYQGKEKILFSTSVNLILITGTLGSILLILLSPLLSSGFQNPTLKLLLWLYVPSIFFDLISSLISMTLIYHNKAKQVAYLVFLSNAIRILFLFISIHFYNSLSLSFILLSMNSLLFMFLNYYFLPPQLYSVKILNKHTIKKTIQLCWPVYLTNFVGAGFFFIDGFIISSLLPIKDFSIYRNGAIEIPFISTIYASVSLILLPEFAKLYGNKKVNEIFATKQKISLLSAAIIYPVIILFIALSHFFIILYLSDKYSESVLIFAIYNLSALVRITDYQDILMISRKNHLILYSNIIVLIINIILNIVLIKLLGIYGAAIAYTLSIYILAFILTYLTISQFNMKVRNYFDLPKIFNIILISCIGSLLVYFINQHIDSNVIKGFVFIFYLIITYLLLIKLNYINLNFFYPIIENMPYGKCIKIFIQKYIHNG